MRTIVSNFDHKRSNLVKQRYCRLSVLYKKYVQMWEKYETQERRRKEDERSEVLNHILFNAYIQASKMMGVKMTPSYNWGRGQCPLSKLFIYRTSGVGGHGGGVR